MEFGVVELNEVLSKINVKVRDVPVVDEERAKDLLDVSDWFFYALAVVDDLVGSPDIDLEVTDVVCDVFRAILYAKRNLEHKVFTLVCARISFNVNLASIHVWTYQIVA